MYNNETLFLNKSVNIYKGDDNQSFEAALNNIIENKCDNLLPCSRQLPLRRGQFFHKIRHKVIQKVRYRNNQCTNYTAADDAEKIFSNISTYDNTNSCYDERNILEMRDETPFDEDILNTETLSTASSTLSITSLDQYKSKFIHQKRRLFSHWGNCMSSSLQKMVKRTVEDDKMTMRGEKAAKYYDMGLYENDSEETPPSETRDDLSFNHKYNNGKEIDNNTNNRRDFLGTETVSEQKQLPEKEATEESYFCYKDPDFGDIPGLGPSFNLLVSFDNNMEQFTTNMDRTISSDIDGFQHVDEQSVASEFDVLQNPNWQGYQHQRLQQKKQEDEQRQLWNNIEAPILDGEVSNPPSPTKISTSREDYWCFGSMHSSGSEITMTEVLYDNKHDPFPSNFTQLTKKPNARSSFERYTFLDELSEITINDSIFENDYRDQNSNNTE